MTKDFPLVEVHWIDAANQADDHDLDTLPELVPCKTVGRLVKRTDEAVWVAAEVLMPTKDASTVRFRGTTVIPSGWVTKTRHLK